MADKHLNANQYVSVQLNDHGRQILKDRFDETYGDLYLIPEYVPLPVDEDGYTRFQLWNLMNIFGDHMSLGLKMPFDSGIKIDEKNLSDG